MDALSKTLKKHRYLFIPILAVLLILPLYRCSSSQKILPEKLGENYETLSASIEKHAQSIADKINVPGTLTSNSFTFKSSDFGLTERISKPAPTLASTFNSKAIQGISFIKDQPLVFINNRVLSEGDQINGITIEKITSESITVREQTGKTTTVYLDPSRQTNS